MLCLTLLSIIFVTCSAEDRLDLGGQWMVDSENGTIKGVEAIVPGGIYSDLMKNDIIGDVLYGYNDVDTRWIGNTTWIYYRDFTVDSSILSNTYVNLVCDGLDTIATISINNQAVGNTENMFRRYIFNIKDQLVEGNNTISITFKSPIQEAARLAEEQAKSYRIPPDCPGEAYHGECHVNMLRKMQASFSWDWGPAFPSVGIWKNIYLESFNTSVIRYVLVDILESGGNWNLYIRTLLDGSTTAEGSITYSLTTDNITFMATAAVDPEAAENRVQIDIPQVKDQFWWPNGYGEQKLYELVTEFDGPNGEISTHVHNIGFRTVKLIQSEAPANGTNFYFQVNNVSIFVKGSNEIPLHVLPEVGQDHSLIERVLGDAQAVNMNMLRVWGGGVYESDYFYEVADRLGILIWQDFMFACAMYPANDEYLDNVLQEVRHQVRRLYNHPSIAIWAGNNENEAALVQDWYGTSANFDVYKGDYVKLYIPTIKIEIELLSNNYKLFVPSSPSNGNAEDEDEGNLAANPQDPTHGDVHFYNYYANSLQASTYPITRFTSEYGYQSLPDLDSWATVDNNVSNFAPFSDFMIHRQHKPDGQNAIQMLIESHFRLPDESHDRYTQAFVFLSQVAQALSIKFESELLRSFTGRYNEKGEGNNMGMLFWQLNDVWVAPTWSSIDYTGKWKILHYMLQECFAKNLITSYVTDQRSLEIYVVSEELSLIGTSVNATVHADVYKWDSFDVLLPYNFTAVIEIGRSVNVSTISDVDVFLVDAGCGTVEDARYNCLIQLTFEVPNLHIAVENFVFPAEIKDSNVPLADVTIVEIQETTPTDYEITVQTDNIALWVWLDSHQIRGKFSRNGFILLAGETTISFTSRESTTIQTLRDTLTVTNLNNPRYKITSIWLFGTAENVFSTPIDDYLITAGCGTVELQDARLNCFFRLSFEIPDLQVSAANSAFPAEIRDSNIILTNARITQVVEVAAGTEFDIKIETDNIIIWVLLDSHQIRGRFSRNGFHLIEGGGVVRFSTTETTTVEALQATLTITSVNDPKYY